MPIGQIIKWNEERGFGFIREEGSAGSHGDFVHITSMPDAQPPRLGARFEFEFERVSGLDGRTKGINLRPATTWGDAAHL